MKSITSNNIKGLQSRFAKLNSSKNNPIETLKENKALRSILDVASEYLKDPNHSSDAEKIAHFLMGKISDKQLPEKFKNACNNSKIKLEEYNDSKLKDTVNDLLRTHRYFFSESSEKTINKLNELNAKLNQEGEEGASLFGRYNASSSVEKNNYVPPKNNTGQVKTKETIIAQIKVDVENADLEQDEKLAKSFNELSKAYTDKQEFKKIVESNELKKALLTFNYKYIDPNQKGFCVTGKVNNQILQQVQSEVREEEYLKKHNDNIIQSNIEKQQQILFSKNGGIFSEHSLIDKDPAILEQFNDYIQRSFGSLENTPEDYFNKSVRYHESGVFTDTINQKGNQSAYGYKDITYKTHYLNQKKHFLKLLGLDSANVTFDNPPILVNNKLSNEIVEAIKLQLQKFENT